MVSPGCFQLNQLLGAIQLRLANAKASLRGVPQLPVLLFSGGQQPQAPRLVYRNDLCFHPRPSLTMISARPTSRSSWSMLS